MKLHERWQYYWCPQYHGKYQRISTEIVEFSIGTSIVLFSEKDVFWTRHELSTRIWLVCKLKNWVDYIMHMRQTVKLTLKW